MRSAFLPFVAGISFAALGALWPRVSAAGGPQPTATLSCPRVSEPGRVRCEVEARLPAGEAILRWADVEIVSAPSFVTPLRGRVGGGEATTREDTVWRWTIALAARTHGSGDVEARVRVVSCVKGACVPLEISVRGAIVVGDPARPPSGPGGTDAEFGPAQAQSLLVDEDAAPRAPTNDDPR